jgi:rubredoxin
MTCKVCGSFREAKMVGEPRPLAGFFTFYKSLPILYACPDCGAISVDTKIFRPKKEALEAKP